MSVCPIMSRSVAFRQYTDHDNFPAGPEIQFAEVGCLLDDCEARYCRQLKAPVRIARKKCGKKDKPSCAECEAAYCRLIEGGN